MRCCKCLCCRCGYSTTDLPITATLVINLIGCIIQAISLVQACNGVQEIGLEQDASSICSGVLRYVFNVPCWAGLIAGALVQFGGFARSRALIMCTTPWNMLMCALLLFLAVSAAGLMTLINTSCGIAATGICVSTRAAMQRVFYAALVNAACQVGYIAFGCVRCLAICPGCGSSKKKRRQKQKEKDAENAEQEEAQDAAEEEQGPTEEEFPQYLTPPIYNATMATPPASAPVASAPPAGSSMVADSV